MIYRVLLKRQVRMETAAWDQADHESFVCL
jgi:hypothetical protein